MGATAVKENLYEAMKQQDNQRVHVDTAPAILGSVVQMATTTFSLNWQMLFCWKINTRSGRLWLEWLGTWVQRHYLMSLKLFSMLQRPWEGRPLVFHGRMKVMMC